MTKIYQQACLKVLSLDPYISTFYIGGLSLSLFIEATTFCNYIDDNTMYPSDKNTNIVINRL